MIEKELIETRQTKDKCLNEIVSDVDGQSVQRICNALRAANNEIDNL